MNYRTRRGFLGTGALAGLAGLSTQGLLGCVSRGFNVESDANRSRRNESKRFKDTWGFERGEEREFQGIDIAPSNKLAPKNLPQGVTKTVLIVGGGIAGLAAGMELAERGYKVTVREAAPYLGGRLHTRVETLPVGTFRIEHGLHMWFYQYYNFFDILKRVGTLDKYFVDFNEVFFLFKETEDDGRKYVPELLESVGPYPINLLGIVLKSPNLNILSALGTAGALPDIMFYDFTGVYRDHDDETLVSYAKRLKVNKDFYNVVMEPAASVTLNNPDLVSAAEMLTFMQLYFLGHPKAFHRKITTVDHGTAVIEPMADHIITYGGEVKVGEPVNGLRFKDGLAKGCVGEKEDYDYVILAADIPGAKKIVNASTADDAASQKALKGLQDGLGGMKVAPVYHILRVWFDKATDPNRPFNQAVIETPRSPVHLIGLFHMLEQECKDWVKSRPNGEGSVVEFHLYNAPKTPGLAKKGLTAEEAWKVIEEECWRILPELKRQGAKPLSMTMGTFENFTSYEVGQASVRPDSLWPSAELGLRNLTLAGDWIATPYPSALMERSVCSAREAANKILVDDNVLEVPLRVARSKGPGVFPRF